MLARDSDDQTVSAVEIPVIANIVLPLEIPISKLQALKKLFKLSMPYAFSSFIVIGGNFIGVVMVSRLGSESMAASNLASSMQNWLTSTVGATLSATAVVAGRKIGNQHPEEVGEILHKSWFLAGMLSVPAITIMLVSKPLFNALGQNPEVVELTDGFFQGYVWGLPAMFMLSANRRITLATSNAHIALLFDLFYQALDSALSYGFIFGLGALPKLGFKGLGYSNSISAWSTLVLLTTYMLHAKRFKQYNLNLGQFKTKDFFPQLWQLAKIGLPVGGKVAAELATLLGASFMIGAMGSDQQAAQEASFQYISIMATFMFSIMDSTGTLVSKSIGAGNLSNAKQMGYIGIGLGTTISSFSLILFAAIPDTLLQAFIDTHDPENRNIVDIASRLLFISGLSLVADSIRNISSGALSGFYDTFKPILLIMLTQALIFGPLGWVLGFPVGMQASGVMIARGVTITVGAILLFLRFFMTNDITQNNRFPSNQNNVVSSISHSSDDETTPLLSGEQHSFFSRHSAGSCCKKLRAYFTSNSTNLQQETTQSERTETTATLRPA